MIDPDLSLRVEKYKSVVDRNIDLSLSTLDGKHYSAYMRERKTPLGFCGDAINVKSGQRSSLEKDTEEREKNVYSKLYSLSTECASLFLSSTVSGLCSRGLFRQKHISLI